MKTFKEIVQEDISNVFMNEMEFADQHDIDGKEMLVSIDSSEQLEREKRIVKNEHGMFVNQTLIYVAAEDFGTLPAVGRILKLDKKKYIITDAIDEDGIYSITLEAKRS